jgi:hypothetical protein
VAHRGDSPAWTLATTQQLFEPIHKDGKSKKEIIRMLKRYVAREIYHYLPHL